MKLGATRLYCIVLVIYYFCMALEESNYSTLGSMAMLLSVVRVFVLAFLILIFALHIAGVKNSMIVGVVLFLFFSVCNMIFSSGGFRFLIMLLFVLCAKNIDKKVIFRVSFWSLLISTLFVILSSMTGIIQDNVNYRWLGSDTILSGEYIRHSYGFLMSNQIAFVLLYLILYSLCIQQENMKMWQHIVFQSVNLFTFMFCGSRVIFLLIVTLSLLDILVVIIDKFHIQLEKLKVVVTVIYPALAITSFVMTYMFGRNFMNPINMLFNFRLSNMYSALKYYGIRLIGNNSDVGTKGSELGIVVDNGYGMLILQKGLVVGILIIAIWYIITKYAIISKNTSLLVATIALAIANLVDYHFISYMNIPFYCLLANITGKRLKCVRSSKKCQYK